MRLGIIAGTGAATLFGDGAAVALTPGPWGKTSAPVQVHGVDDHELFILPRHGAHGGEGIPPHRVNYRANVWAFKTLAVEHVLGINAVGGIAPEAAPGRLVIPDQIIDYTWGREHTYTGDSSFPLRHVEFTTPFSEGLRDLLLAAGRCSGVDLLTPATYGVTQGPRLETSAEIDRLEQDRCHIVGMTAMPEAGLARELDLSYAICCVVVNHAAGRGPGGLGIHAEMATSLKAGMAGVRRLVEGLLRAN